MSDAQVDEFLRDIVRISEEQDMPLRKLFKKMDATHDKHITVAEIAAAMGKYGATHVDRDTIERALAPFDREHDGRLTFSEFVRMVAERHDPSGDDADRYALSGADSAAPGQHASAPLQRPQALTTEELAERYEEEVVELMSLAMLRTGRTPEDMFRDISGQDGGRVSLAQFKAAARSVGCDVPKDDIVRLFMKYDRDLDARIDRTQFLEMLGPRFSAVRAEVAARGGSREAVQPPRRSELAGPVGNHERAVMRRILEAIEHSHEKLREVFTSMDREGSKTVSWKEFRAGIAGLGADLTKEDVLKLFSRYDRDHDGRIRYGEFVRLVSEHGEGQAPDPNYFASLPEASRSEQIVRGRDDGIARDFAGGAPGSDDSSVLQSFLTESNENPLVTASQRAHNESLGPLTGGGGGGGGGGAGATPEDFARNRELSGLEMLHLRIVTKLYRQSERTRDMFLSLDLRGDGFLTHSELRTGLSRLGIEVSEHEVALLVGPYEKDGALNYNAFLQFLQVRGREIAAYRPGDVRPLSEADHDYRDFLTGLRNKLSARSGSFRELFLMFDKERDAMVSYAEIKGELESIGVNFDMDDLVRLVRSTPGLERDGVVDFVGFIDMISGHAGEDGK